MANQNKRYKEMTRYMTYALSFAALMFILFLIFAGIGMIWGKVITAVLTILVSGLCLAFLYLSRELLRTRSLWMTAAAIALIACTVFSLILNFPSPNPLV